MLVLVVVIVLFYEQYLGVSALVWACGVLKCCIGFKVSYILVYLHSIRIRAIFRSRSSSDGSRISSGSSSRSSRSSSSSGSSRNLGVVEVVVVVVLVI